MFDDRIGEAINLVRLGDVEMIQSYPVKAKTYYLQAAELLASLVPTHKTQYEKTSISYSAAVAFYNAGEYGKCMGMLNSVNSSILEDAEGFQELYSSCKDKGANYPTGIIAEIEKQKAKARDSGGDNYTARNCYRKVLEILRDNPYIYAPQKMVEMRMEALRIIGKRDEAELFTEDLDRLNREMASCYHAS